MKELAQSYGFEFPYLFDESQEVAISFRAACTPDFFFLTLIWNCSTGVDTIHQDLALNILLQEMI